MATRRQVRESVVAVLYALGAGNDEAIRHADEIFEERKIRNKQREFGHYLLGLVMENLSAIDEKLQIAMKEWELSRVGAIERAILRLGACEVLFENVDRAVVINEAVELGKLFGAENSAKFINGVLDALRKEQA